MPTILLNKIKKGSTAVKNITVGSKEVKYAYKGSTLIYDTLSHNNTSTTYGTPTITVTYPTLSRNGGTVTPTITYSQTKTTTTTPVGHSGNTYSSSSSSTTITGTVTSFTATGSVKNSSGATIASSTGKVTRSSLGTTYKSAEWAIMDVTITATVNGKQGTGTATVKMQSNTYSQTGTDYKVTVDVDPGDRYITAAGERLDIYPYACSFPVYTYQTGSTSNGTETQLACTVKIYVSGSLNVTKSLTSSESYYAWNCPSNTTNSLRTISLNVSCTATSKIATWSNTQPNLITTVFTFEKGWDIISHPMSNSGANVIVTIHSYSNRHQNQTVNASASVNVSWAIATVATNTTPYPGNIVVTVIASKNSTGSPRSGTLTVTQTGSGKKLTYTFTQDA